MRGLRIVLLCIAIVTRPAGAQDRSARLKLVLVPDDTGKAVVTAAEFLQKITPVSIRLAECTSTRSDSGSAHVLTVGSTRIRLPANETSRSFCKTGAVREADGALLIVEGIRQIEKDVILPSSDQINFEIMIQIQYGMSTREWHTLIVQPHGFIPTNTGMEARSWRVSRWEITGWRTH